jgi:two-component system, OmpR family, response regulator MprA
MTIAGCGQFRGIPFALDSDRKWEILRRSESRNHMSTRILIVDDDPAIVQVLEQLLDDEGFEVRYALDGREALTEIPRIHPDVILSDIMMPTLDGVELTRTLRDQGDPTPIVLMSAVFGGVDLPGVRFIAKPFDVDQLVHVVQRAVDTSRAGTLQA